ncbi:substrate-binding periplasmic protein [Chitinimonas sp. PSY-7]|uniref:substrate-binding periplasmic protein n=1 Tax=Chitinimonas sp. PSY-7 TaxID=3459088 RepID=UPI0040401073
MLALITAAHAAETVRLANGEWPPYAGESLPHGGIGTRIVRAALAEEGINAEFVYLSWKRGLEIAKRGMLDGAILWAPTPEKLVDFLPSETIMSSDVILLYRQNKPLDMTKPSQMKGYQLGLPNGYSYNQYPELINMIKESGKQAIIIADDDLGVKALIQERIDAYPIDRHVARWILANMATPPVPIVVYEPPIKAGPLTVLFNIKSPRAKWLQERMNAGLAKLRASGQLAIWIQELGQATP